MSTSHGAPPHPREADRQAALDALKLLDTPGERRFDLITESAREAFQVPMALVSLVDRNRQWFKAAQGLSVPQTDRCFSFCAHAILKSEVFEIPDASRDDRFRDNPLVTGPPHVRFYAGVPVRAAAGLPLGTLCILDTEPRRLDALEQMRLKSLAGWLETELRSPAEQKHGLDLSAMQPDSGDSRWLDADTKCWNEDAGRMLLSELLRDAQRAGAPAVAGVVQLRLEEAGWRMLADCGRLGDARLRLANLLRTAFAEEARLFARPPDLIFYLGAKPGRLGRGPRLAISEHLLAATLHDLGSPLTPALAGVASLVAAPREDREQEVLRAVTDHLRQVPDRELLDFVI